MPKLTVFKAMIPRLSPHSLLPRAHLFLRFLLIPTWNLGHDPICASYSTLSSFRRETLLYLTAPSHEPRNSQSRDFGTSVGGHEADYLHRLFQVCRDCPSL